MCFKKILTKIMIRHMEKTDAKRLSAQSLPGGIQEITDIAYIEGGGKEHLLDIYYPEGASEKLPLIIDIHGGGLVYGRKENNKNYCYNLAKRGFAVFNINYRLVHDRVKIPHQLQDIAAAVKWIAGNAGNFPADINKAFITGDSAGGYLAAHIALAAGSGRLQKLFGLEMPGVSFKASGIISGMMNLDNDKLLYRGLRSVCLERGYKKQEYYQDLIFDKIPEMKNFPPCYLVTSKNDPLNYMTFSFEAVLKKNGTDYRLRYFDKKERNALGHIFSIAYPALPESAEVIDEMLNFFKETLLE